MSRARYTKYGRDACENRDPAWQIRRDRAASWPRGCAARSGKAGPAALPCWIAYFLKRHLSLLACDQSTRCLAQNRRIVSDFRHLCVWNFRRIVFHASLQVESSCYRFFLCWSPGHDIDKRQRKISRVAPFVHGSHARGLDRGRSVAPQCVRQKQTNGRQRTFVRKKVRSWKSQTNNIRMFEHSLQLKTPLLCACAVVITLETQKCRKRAPCSVEFNFLLIAIDTNVSQNERRRADLQNSASDFLIFALDLVMIFQSLVMILPRFSTLKDHN